MADPWPGWCGEATFRRRFAAQSCNELPDRHDPFQVERVPLITLSDRPLGSGLHERVVLIRRTRAVSSKASRRAVGTAGWSR